MKGLEIWDMKSHRDGLMFNLYFLILSLSLFAIYFLILPCMHFAPLVSLLY